MVSHLDIEVVESIIRSFGKETFTMENIKAAMVNIHPRRRVSAVTASNLMTAYHLAERVGTAPMKSSKTLRQATTIWRSLL
jgi:hypothetical protein